MNFLVTHASDVSKLHNGGKIIEVKIESENDIQRIVDDGFIESSKCDSRLLEGIESENISETTFWGFKSEDYDAKNITQEIRIFLVIFYMHPVSHNVIKTHLCVRI